MAGLLAIAVGLTVFIISYGYSRIIEHFPAGGGGDVVASKYLGASAGLVSGAALLVDYVLTIAVSLASGGDAVFSFMPHLLAYKLTAVLAVLVILTLMNLRGVKESILARSTCASRARCSSPASSSSGTRAGGSACSTTRPLTPCSVASSSTG